MSKAGYTTYLMDPKDDEEDGEGHKKDCDRRETNERERRRHMEIKNRCGMCSADLSG